MAEYVAEMSCRVVTGDASAATSSFRKTVLTILSSTRLPRTTILLGMNYLAKRINTLKNAGVSVGATVTEISELLTVALMLGSKFLDDNTFQNKSWSDVSGIAVARLNAIETKWIVSMDWVLYVNLDTASDYKAWLGSWDEWVRTKKDQQAAQAAQAAAQAARKQAPLQRIDTDVSRLNGYARQHYHYGLQSALEPLDYNAASYAVAAAKRRSYQAPSPYRAQDSMWQSPSWHAHAHGQWSATPVTPPPDSGYGTPEYGLSATAVPQQHQQQQSHFGNDWYGAYSAGGYQPAVVHSMYMQQQPQQQQQRQGAFSNMYSFGSSHHGMAGCACASCGPAKVPSHAFFNVPHGNFGTVMG
jgi:hypothetical protein